MKKRELSGMREDITSLIDDIKYHSDTLTDLERLPVIQLKVILAKINKLTEKTTILLHYVEKEGKLSEIEREIKAESKTELHQPEVEEATKTTQAEPVSENGSKPKNVEEKLKSIVIKDLNTAIGINEKYLYASELFNSDTEKFAEAINKINGMTERAELDEFIAGLSSVHNWDMENETLLNFLDLIYRKFD
jgi:hypothetical protein